MCSPPRIPGNLEERTARRSLPATFVGGVQLFNGKMVCPQAFAEKKWCVPTRLRLPVLSPGRAEWNSQGCQPLVASKPKIQALEGATGMLACWKMLRYVSPLRGSGFPRKPITGVGTPGYCMPHLQRLLLKCRMIGVQSCCRSKFLVTPPKDRTTFPTHQVHR